MQGRQRLASEVFVNGWPAAWVCFRRRPPGHSDGANWLASFFPRILVAEWYGWPDETGNRYASRHRYQPRLPSLCPGLPRSIVWGGPARLPTGLPSTERYVSRVSIGTPSCRLKPARSEAVS